MRFSIKFFIIVVVFIMTGCTSTTSLMFIPYKNYPLTPDKININYQTIEHYAADGTPLVSWWMPAAGDAKGTVLFLHGNAQNISYHQFSVNWLPSQGYNVFLLGYREYGQSEGLAKLPQVFMDVHGGLDWIYQHADLRQKPTFVLGQSMGASLAVFGVASYPQKDFISGVVLDSTFDSYPGIAAEIMSRHWISWVLQLPAYMISSDYDPIDWVNNLPDVPLLMFHSVDDEIVPYERGLAVYEESTLNKRWVQTQGKHIRTFRADNNRALLLEFFASAISISSN